MEWVLMWLFLLLGCFEVEPGFFVAAGVFAIAGHLGRIMDIFMVEEGESE